MGDAVAAVFRGQAGWSTLSVDDRAVCDAIVYLTRSGGQWRRLPTDFPTWQTVY